MQKKTTTRATPRVSGTAIEFYDRFPTRNSGIEWAVESMPRLIQATQARELRGQFTRGELSMILDVLNGHGSLLAASAAMTGMHVALSIEDSFDLYPGTYEDKLSVDKTAMTGKLRALTVFQLAALEVWAAQFWEGDYNAPDAVQKHCAPLEAGERA